MMLDTIIQISLPVLGLPSIFLMARKNRWGVIFGCAAQPFWFLMAIRDHKWGLFALTLGYAVSWVIGVYTWWIKPRRFKTLRLPETISGRRRFVDRFSIPSDKIFTREE